MGIFVHLPDQDWRNDGWALVGSAVTRLFEALDNDDDSKYVRTPASKGQATVAFPVDTSNVPEGAVIVSVSVKLRCATGSGSAPAGTSPSITVAVSADDDTSRFVTRTIYPNSTIQTYEVASYRLDALGFRWDVHRLNHILCRVFSYIGIFDLIRCYKFFCEVNYRVRPTLTIDSPTGTVATPSPVLSWTYTQTDGDPQSKAEYKIFTSVAKSQISFNPETATPIYHGTVAGDLSTLTLPTSLNADSYWVYVRAVSNYGAKSVWTGRQFVVTGSTPGSPGVPDPDNPGTAMIRVVPDRAAGLAQLTLRDTSNLLDANTADAEHPTDHTSATATNCTITRSTVEAFPGGTASWRLSSTGTGTMGFVSDWVEIDPSAPLTARAQFKTAAVAKSCRLRIMFYDDEFSSAGVGSITGSSITDSDSTWTEAVLTGDVPDNAVYARLVCEVLTPSGAAELHYVDRIGLMYGTNTAYSDGGHISRNLLSGMYSTADSSPIPAGETWSPGPATTVAVNAPIGVGASGSRCTKMTYLGLTPTIGFRGVGTAFNSATSGTNYTINKPAGAVVGDLALAYVTVNHPTVSCSPPAGWELADTVRANGGGEGNVSMFVLKRTIGAADPASWDGYLGVAVSRRTAIAVAYSGAADVSAQPVASGGASTLNPTPLYLTTPTVSNPDPNAWRVSAFAVADNAAGGTLTANRQPPSSVPPIGYVGKSSVWGRASAGTSFTINKPSGVTSGNYMLAFMSVSGDVTSVTPPSGWTVVSRTVANAGNSTTSHTHVVLSRFAGSSEPSSWSGTIAGSIGKAIMTGVVAYRNVHASTPLINQSGKSAANGTTITSNAVSNNNSAAWRVSSFAMKQQTTSHSEWSSNEALERMEEIGGYDNFFGTDDVVNLQISDSNGAVSGGSYTRQATASRSWNGAGAWVGFLNPLGAPPAPVSDEAPRGVATVGASTPWLTTRMFDSGAIVPAGAQSITGLWAPGSGTDMSALLGWQGIIRPAAAQTAGYASAKMVKYVDISTVDPAVLDLCGRKIAVTTAFLGTVGSTPYLTVEFYRANQMIDASVIEGTPFNTAVWAKSAAVLDIPDGTTRMKLGVSASDLEVADSVYFDRVSLALGTDTTYRPGTSREVHPVWSRPLLQFADDRGDGYGEFMNLHGTLASTPGYAALSGLVMFEDHTVVPLTNRKYRARTLSYGLNGDTFVSDIGPESSDFRFIAEMWWLKDVHDPSRNVQLLVKAQKVDVSQTNTATVFQPLGRDLPVVLSEGFKGDSFSLTLLPVDLDGWGKLKSLLASKTTLFLQSDVDDAWWVRCIGNINRGVLVTGNRRENPLREVTVTFVQVEPVE